MPVHQALFWANSDNLLHIEAKTLRLTCLDIEGDDLRWRHRKIHLPGRHPKPPVLHCKVNEPIFPSLYLCLKFEKSDQKGHIDVLYISHCSHGL